MTDKAATYDDGKEPLAHLPWAGLKAVSRVQMYGHKKYKDFNNYRKGMEVSRNLSCAMRHIVEYLEGKDNDHESGESHLAHAAARVLFVLQNLAEGTAVDDRFKPADDTPPAESMRDRALRQMLEQANPVVVVPTAETPEEDLERVRALSVMRQVASLGPSVYSIVEVPKPLATWPCKIGIHAWSFVEASGYEWTKQCRACGKQRSGWCHY